MAFFKVEKFIINGIKMHDIILQDYLTTIYRIYLFKCIIQTLNIIHKRKKKYIYNYMYI